MFYATVPAEYAVPWMPAVPVMLPASSWARERYRLRAPKLPAHVTELAADCGGYVATRVWGDYRYTPEQYVDWLYTWRPQWAATMDYCCEPDLGVKVLERQVKTTEMAYRFWVDFRGVPWVWVPTLQGWEIGDYERHASELAPLVLEMAAHYGPSAFRVGIGTLCRRASAQMVQAVVATVSAVLPGIPLHLWGVKLSILADGVQLKGVTSVDSGAWNGLFATGREEWRRSGLTQRRWVYQVALPRYLSKINRALETPKQLSLAFGEHGGCG